MITGNQINIPLTGLSSALSDYDCTDGDLSVCHNLINTGAGLHPVQKPEILTNEDEETLPDLDSDSGDTVVFIHKTSNGTNYIAWNYDKYAHARLGDDEWTDLTLQLDEGSAKFSAIGNVLIMTLSDAGNYDSAGIHYFRWKTDDYEHLGQRPPELDVSFELVREASNIESEQSVEYTRDDSLDLDWNTSIEVQNAVFGKVNTLVAEAKEKGYFLRPFLARWAFRLYDGNYIMQSAPFMLIPDYGANPYVLADIPNYIEDKKKGTVKFVSNIKRSKLKITTTISQEVGQDLSKWKDIIQSIDIFVTPQILNYYNTGNLSYVTYTTSAEISGCPLGGFYGGYAQDTNPAAGNNADNGFHNYDLESMVSGTYTKFIVLPKRDDTIKESVEGAYNFFLYHSIPFNEIKNGSVKPKVNLTNLEAKEQLTDGYMQRVLRMPKHQTSYNSRLNIANVDIMEDKNIQSHTLFPPTSSCAPTDVKVYIERDGVWNVVSCQSRFTYEIAKHPGYFFYPSPYAKWLQYGDKYFQMKSHPFLYGSYYFNGWFAASGTTTRPAELEGVTESEWMHQTNYMYTSEVDNPFFFPSQGVNAIGNGEIINISTATKAVSEGTAFGTHPLYAFCTDGIYPVHVADNGLFSSIGQPTAREIPLSEDAILQIDDSVIFIGERGLMELRGGKTTLLSAALNGRYPSTKAVDLKGWTNMHKSFFSTANAVISPAYKEAYEFKQFIKTAKLAFDYANYRIYVYSPSSSIAYVYSIATKTWSTCDSTMKSSLNGYPSTYINMTDENGLNRIGVFGIDSDSLIYNGKGFYVTRPMKLGKHDLFKTMRNLIERGVINAGNKKYLALYGSDDMVHWDLLGGKVGCRIPRLSGSAYKYFIVAGWSHLSANGNVISRLTVEERDKLTNKLR